MPPRKLQSVLSEFSSRMRESRRLANYAREWSLHKGKSGRPFISGKRRDSIIELAFLRAFLAWEAFLEKSFLLYLAGKVPPRGRLPKRYYFPPSHKMAMDWLAEGRDYAKWADAGEVGKRAARFFQDGHPFTSVLRSNQTALADANIIRNMIAHESSNTRQKFEKIARRELSTLPINRTAGAFLGTTVPTSSPPVSFLESYVSKLESCAKQIIPL